MVNEPRYEPIRYDDHELVIRADLQRFERKLLGIIAGIRIELAKSQKHGDVATRDVRRDVPADWPDVVYFSNLWPVYIRWQAYELLTKGVIHMPEGNKPLDSDDTRNHHWAIFRNEGQHGAYLQVNIEHGYRKDDGKLNQSNHYTIKELSDDITLRMSILHEMRQMQRELKQEAKQIEEPAEAPETVATAAA